MRGRERRKGKMRRRDMKEKKRDGKGRGNLKHKLRERAYKGEGEER